MKKFLILFIVGIILSTVPTFAETDKYSEEYLKNKRHCAIANPLAEGLVEHALKKVLKKETGSNFKVKFTAYTLSSLKKGVFKSVELESEDLLIENIPISYAHLKSVTDYNYIDYKSKPVAFKSNMEFDYELLITEETINEALKRKEYNDILNKVNKLAYPLFEIKKVKTKIFDNRLYIAILYNFPVNPKEKNKIFIVSSLFAVKDGKIVAKDISLDEAYKKISLKKVANLVNLVNPLEFMLSLLDSKKSKATVKNLEFVDNKIKVNGTIFIKEQK